VFKEFYNNIVDYLLVTFDANFIFLTMLLTTFVSVIYFIVISYIITQMDKRYFIRQKKDDVLAKKTPKKLSINNILGYMIKAAKIIIGVFLLMCGILMLVLPGQGIITMIIGLSLIPFPGKDKFEQSLLARKSVRSSLNWIRAKANKELFIFD
jgi:type IV secretory pathway VirB6-like protein